MAAAGSQGLVSARYGDSPVNTDYPRGAWTLALVCTAAMPIFGGAAAALYWLLRP